MVTIKKAQWQKNYVKETITLIFPVDIDSYGIDDKCDTASVTQRFLFLSYFFSFFLLLSRYCYMMMLLLSVLEYVGEDIYDGKDLNDGLMGITMGAVKENKYKENQF